MSTKEPIRPYDDKFMVEANLRPPMINIDKTIFQKTLEEKRLLKQMKKSCFRRR